MAREDFRAWLNAVREQVEQEANRDKDGSRALLELGELYRSFAGNERLAADDVIIEWALSEKLDQRFDGLALVNMERIRSAAPALRQLAERLQGEPGPQAPYDLAKVERILVRLTEKGC